MIKRGFRLHWLLRKAGRLRSGIGVKSWSLDFAAAGPESRTDNFVGVGFAGDGVGLWSWRSAAAGEARDGQVEASPEKMHWTIFADEAGAEFLEDDVAQNQNLPEAVGVFGIVGGVLGVSLEGDWTRDLDRHGPDSYFYTQRLQGGHELGIEGGDGLRFQGKGLCRAPACLDGQLVVDEVELHFEDSAAVGNG